MEFNITPQKLYNILSTNKEIHNIYTNIEKKEIEEGGWAFHNLEHVKNVSKMAEKILSDLNFDEDTIYKCKIACLLHDIGALQGKKDHAKRSYIYAKKLFESKNWIFEDSENILNAIEKHSSGFETNNIINLTIILADKLDIKENRISEAGKLIEGNRQYAHIKDIIINIEENIMIINFVTDGNINMKEINNYYFTHKVFKSIESFTAKLNLKHHILMDNKVWNL